MKLFESVVMVTLVDRWSGFNWKWIKESFVGDGNIHLNITVKEYSEEILKKIEPFVYEYTSKLRGSVSAEHGIGFRKPKYIRYSKSQNAIELMKQLKKLMDPNGILNPYKVVPP